MNAHEDDLETPNFIESETQLLGALMLGAAIDAELSPLDFYRAEHQVIYSAVASLASKNAPIDSVTVTQELKRVGQLEEAGGWIGITELQTNCVSVSSAQYHANKIKTASNQRRALQISQRLLKDAGNFDNFNELVSQAGATLAALGESTERKRAPRVTLRELTRDVLEDIEHRCRNPGMLLGVPSGIPDLDDLTSGFMDGDLVLIGARPSVGKTTLGLSIANKMASHYKLPVAFFTLEMRDKQLIEKSLSAFSGVVANKMRWGTLSDEEIAILRAEADRISELSITLIDRSGTTSNTTTTDDIEFEMRELHKEGIYPRAIIVDQVHSMNGKDSSLDLRHQISQITRGLKVLAVRFMVPVIALCQLNRDAGKKEIGKKTGERTVRKPVMTDLKETGAAEQDADTVILIHRDDYQNFESTKKGEAELLLVKQRSGPTGEVTVRFNIDTQTFQNMVNREFPQMMPRREKPVKEEKPKLRLVKPEIPFKVLSTPQGIFYKNDDLVITKKVWSVEQCRKKLAANDPDLFTKAYAWVGEQTAGLEREWAQHCVNVLEAEYDRQESERKALGEFGF